MPVFEPGGGLPITYGYQVADHEDDDHQCAATTHACGEVTVIFYFP